MAYILASVMLIGLVSALFIIEFVGRWRIKRRLERLRKGEKRWDRALKDSIRRLKKP